MGQGSGYDEAILLIILDLVPGGLGDSSTITNPVPSREHSQLLGAGILQLFRSSLT